MVHQELNDFVFSREARGVHRGLALPVGCMDVGA